MRLNTDQSPYTPPQVEGRKTPCKGCVNFDNCPWLAAVDQQIGCQQFIANFESGDAEGIKDHDITYL